MLRTQACILVVEDHEGERKALARVLRLEGFQVLSACNPAEALTFMEQPIDLVITDLNMGTHSGLDLIQFWRQKNLHTPFLLVTAFGTVDTAVQAMKLGALDFVTKPVDPLRLIEMVRRVLGSHTGSVAHNDVMRRINTSLVSGQIVGTAASLVDVCEKTIRAAQSDSTVLILGESGTGKELIAEAIHYQSPRRDKPFVVVNMAAIPETLVESELFGHIKGAFTSAMQQRIGRFEQAQGGTLFIDEIGDFPLTVQAKLLRVLESRRFWSLGSDQEKTADVRVVAATSRPLPKLVQSGAFREDLYFRLNVIPLHLPPLRQRRQDIPLLTDYFLKAYATGHGKSVPRVAPALRQRMEQYDWPGNIRQLRNCVERMCVFARSEVLSPADLPADIFPTEDSSDASNASRMDSLKRAAILEALDQFGGNRTRAAEFLGISLRTLQRKLREWGMTASPSDSD